jgi:restriction system protein
MGRRRGFFAELQYQTQLAAKQQAQAERAQARAHAAAVRQAEQARRRAHQAATAAARASAAEQKAAEREAKRLYEEARLAEVDELNTELEEIADKLESILAATLTVDDFVDLEELRVTATHPPFPRADLEGPVPPVKPVLAPPKPVLVEPEAPTGIGGIFGKKRHAAAVEEAREAFETKHEKWKAEAAAVPARQLEQTNGEMRSSSSGCAICNPPASPTDATVKPAKPRLLAPTSPWMRSFLGLPPEIIPRSRSTLGSC